MIGVTHYVALSFVLFAIGVTGVLIRRNLLTVLMSIELILNAANLNLIAFSRQLGDLNGQLFAVFVITLAAGEAAIASSRPFTNLERSFAEKRLRAFISILLALVNQLSSLGYAICTSLCHDAILYLANRQL